MRILIGDEIGLGKTITAVVLGKYLQDVGRVRRVLILVPRILVPQWVEELSYWVGMDNIHQVERENIETYCREGFTDGWYIVSMDLFVRNNIVRKSVFDVNWDLIIVDEVHKVSPETAKKRWKYIGDELIAKHPERNVILLSATPHKGFPDDYIARLQILDPNLEPDVYALDNKRFYKQTWNVLIFRRMKNDVNNIYEKREIFKPAHLRAVLIKPSRTEIEFYKEAEAFLLELLRKYREVSGKRLGAVKLLSTLLAKRAFSSPVAAYSTLFFMTAKRAGLLRKIGRREAEEKANALRSFIRSHLAGDYVAEETLLSEKEKALLKEVVGATEPSLDNVLNAFASYASILLDENDVKKLEKLMELAEKVRMEGDTKTSKLEELVKYHLDEGSKIIIFTEYLDTAHYIAGKLRESIGDVIKVLTGKEASSKRERENVEKNFIKDSKYRVLVSTDILSEGLNLQVSNVLVNYDLPWSPLKLEQRVGRVWRLGQEKECFIYMLVVGSSEEATGASRVVSKLYTKLLNMERAQLGKINLVLGKDVEVYDRDLSRRGYKETALYVAEKETKKGRKSITEADVVLASLDDRKFEEFVKWYIETIKHIERKIIEKNVDPEIRHEITKGIIDTTGFESQEDIRSLLLDLARTLARSHGALVTISEGKELIKDSFYQKALQDMSTKELIKVVQSFIDGRRELIKPFHITVWGHSKTSKIHIVKVSLSAGNVIRYEDILGVDESSGEILSSVKLLKDLLLIAEKPCQVSKLSAFKDEMEKLWIKSTIQNCLRKKLFAIGVDDIGKYAENLAYQNLRSGDEWNKITSFNEVGINVDYIGLLNMRQDYVEDFIEQLVGEYDEKKFEIEGEAITIIKERLGQLFAIQDLHEGGYPFDLILIKRGGGEPREQRIVEVKSWKHIDVIIYTKGEKSFGEENEKKGGNYWLYVVDLRDDPPHILGYKRPFTANTLEFIRKVTKGNKEYYVFRIAREADEVW